MVKKECRHQLLKPISAPRKAHPPSQDTEFADKGAVREMDGVSHSISQRLLREIECCKAEPRGSTTIVVESMQEELTMRGETTGDSWSE